MNFIIGFFAVSGVVFWLVFCFYLLLWFLSKEMDYMQQKEPLTEQEWWEETH